MNIIKRIIKHILNIFFIIGINSFMTTGMCVQQKNTIPDNSYRIYVLIGYPGAGKGTFAQALKERGYIHLCCGEILKKELQKGTEIAVKYKEVIEKGIKLLPDKMVQDIMENKILQALANKEKIILDGFPRTVEQAKNFETFVKKNGLEESVYYIYIEISPEKLLERIASRRTCSKCHKIYNVATHPPHVLGFCDNCKAPLEQRNSDNLIDAKIRIDEYKGHIGPLVNYCKKFTHFIAFRGDRAFNECVKDYLALDSKS